MVSPAQADHSSRSGMRSFNGTRKVLPSTSSAVHRPDKTLYYHEGLSPTTPGIAPLKGYAAPRFEMRLSHKFYRVDKAAPFRDSLDTTPDDFAESHSVPQLILQLKGREDFERLFLSNEWHNDFRRKLSKLLVSDRKTLSVGSGFGEIEVPFILEGHEITCSDIVVDALAHTRTLYPQFKYLRLDILNGSASDDYDDILITGLDFAFDDLQVRKLFSSCGQILKKSARQSTKRLIFTLRYNDNVATRVIDRFILPLEASLANAAYALTQSPHRVRRKVSGFRRSRKEIVRLANSCGFSVGRVLHCGFGVEFTRSAILAKIKPLAAAVARADRLMTVFNNVTIYEFILDTGAL
jgi:hypothetical protein